MKKTLLLIFISFFMVGCSKPQSVPVVIDDIPVVNEELGTIVVNVDYNQISDVDLEINVDSNDIFSHVVTELLGFDETVYDYTAGKLTINKNYLNNPSSRLKRLEWIL